MYFRAPPSSEVFARARDDLEDLRTALGARRSDASQICTNKVERPTRGKRSALEGTACFTVSSWELDNVPLCNVSHLSKEGLPNLWEHRGGMRHDFPHFRGEM